MPKTIEPSDELAAQSAPYKYAVFSGGGAKGVIYSGAHEALSDAGILSGLEAVAGSSAGAITAAFIATGISKKDCKALSETTNFGDLLGSGLIEHDGKPIYQLLHGTITNNVGQYIEDLDTELVCVARISEIEAQQQEVVRNKASYTEEEFEIKMEQYSDATQKLRDVKDNKGREVDELWQRVNSGGKIYFKDLALLKLLNPKQFKDLIVTATNRETGELVIFSTHTTPDIEIALACRASAAIPRVLEPVTIDGTQYVDGGYRDNIPQQYFEKHAIRKPDTEQDITGSKSEIKKAVHDGRILVMAFGHGMDDSANIAVYSAQQRVLSYGEIIGFLVDIICKIALGVGGWIRFSKAEEATYEKLRENALNVVILDTGEVGTLSFKTSQEQAAYLHIKGRMQTTQHLRNHSIADEKYDKYFDHKNFMLSVYEQSLLGTAQPERNNEILIGLLSFCEPKQWPQDKHATDVLSDYIKTAATDLADYRLKTTTPAIKTLITVLNDKSTPNSVRQSFIDTLGLDIGPVAKEHLHKFQFKPEDFQELITAHKKRDTLETSRKQVAGLSQHFAPSSSATSRDSLPSKARPSLQVDMFPTTRA
jgi:NTE family protein